MGCGASVPGGNQPAPWPPGGTPEKEQQQLLALLQEHKQQQQQLLQATERLSRALDAAAHGQAPPRALAPKEQPSAAVRSAAEELAAQPAPASEQEAAGSKALAVARAVGSAALDAVAEEEEAGFQNCSTNEQQGEDWVQDKIAAAERLRDAGLAFSDGTASMEDAASVLDMVESVVSTVSDLVGAAKKGERDKPVDVQALVLPRRTGAEQALAKYLALGQVLISLSAKAMEAMPFGAPAAAMLGAVYGRAAQAAKTSRNCELLLALMKRCDAQLARVAGRPSIPADVQEGLQELTECIVQAAKLMHTYAGQGFLMRFIVSSGNEQRFQAVHVQIQEIMVRASFSMSIELLASDYKDECGALRAAVCTAAGYPGTQHTPEQAEAALRKLSASNPKLLRGLLQQHGNFTTQIITAELSALGARVDALEDEVRVIKGELLVLIAQRNRDSGSAGPVGLASFLETWWATATASRLSTSTKAEAFVQRLVGWFKEQNLMDRLLEYEREMAAQGLAVPQPASAQQETGGQGQSLCFLDVVVLPLLDMDHDGVVTRSELHQLQILANDFAKKVAMNAPSSWPELLDAVFMGFDREQVANLAKTAGKELSYVTKELKALDIIRSYNVPVLLDEFVEGTRQWMFDRVSGWLEAALGTASDTAAADVPPDSRMFLLLAGPGMGKSVFSARLQSKLVVRAHGDRKLVHLRHFFKVGQLRSQGKACVLCLAQQAAEMLPGMAALLVPVVEEHGCASNLTMLEAFEKYLLQPLLELDRSSEDKHMVVVLLDALDEAADGARGWEPVASMVATMFIKLPAWVKVILTSRPQTQAAFEGWAPVWITPEAEANQADMRVILKARLAKAECVAAKDKEAAVELLLKKSEGQFIYAKFAFDALRERPAWSLQALEDELPSGLSGQYRSVMATLRQALQDERPDLLTLLRGRVLPILVAAREPLTGGQLALLAKANAADVDQLLHLISNLFPCRPSQGLMRVSPYHKSVLDWLTNPQQAGEHAVDVGLGHACLGQACYDVMRAPGTGKGKPAAPQQAELGEEASSPEAEALSYALRHGIAHLCLGEASQLGQLLEQLALDFEGLWQRAYAAGFGPDVMKDLMALGPASSATVKDVARWLQIVNNYLTRHPEAALQLACDAPRKTIVAQHAAQLPHRPRARLQTKGDYWPACLTTVTGHTAQVACVAAVPNSDLFVSGSRDETIRIWSRPVGEPRATLEGHAGIVNCVAVTPDGATIVSGGHDNTIRLWDVATGRCKATLQGPDEGGTIEDVALTPDGSTIVVGCFDFRVRLWDLATGQLKATLEGAHESRVSCVAAMHDTVASGGDDWRIKLWDLATHAEKKTLDVDDGAVMCLAATPDGRLLVSGSRGKTIKLWDLRTFELKASLKGHSCDVYGLCITLDGLSIVSASYDKTVRVWDIASASLKATLRGHTAEANACAVTSDGTTVISGAWDKAIRLWDLQNCGDEDVEGHEADVTCLVVTPDGRTCVTASYDTTIRLWDLASGALRGTLYGHGAPVTWLAIDPTGKLLASFSNDETMRTWDIELMGQLSVHQGAAAPKQLAAVCKWVVEAGSGARAASLVAWRGADEAVHWSDAQGGGGLLHLMPPLKVGPHCPPVCCEHSRTITIFTEGGALVRYEL